MVNSTDERPARRSRLSGYSREALLALATFALLGCSKSPYELAPVRGVVTIDGQPFSQGKVMFAPVAKGESRNAGRAAFGRLQPDGTFSLTTYDDEDGAVVGEHWATLIRLDDAPSAAEDDGKSTAPAIGALPPFARVTYSQRISILANQENEVTIAFTKQDLARFAEQDD